MEFNGEGLIVHGRMTSHKNPDITPLGFTGDESGDTEGNVDLTSPFCYEGARIHAVAVPPTYPDHLMPFSQDRKSTPISATPVEQGTSHSILPSPKTEDLPSIASACSSNI